MKPQQRLQKHKMHNTQQNILFMLCISRMHARTHTHQPYHVIPTHTHTHIHATPTTPTPPPLMYSLPPTSLFFHIYFFHPPTHRRDSTHTLTHTSHFLIFPHHNQPPTPTVSLLLLAPSPSPIPPIYPYASLYRTPHFHLHYLS